MHLPELARLFYNEIWKIHHDTQSETTAKIHQLHSLLTKLLVELTAPEKLHFTTLFARMAFVCQKYAIQKQKQFYLHTFRKVVQQQFQGIESEQPTELNYQLGLRVLTDLVSTVHQTTPPDTLLDILPANNFYPTRPAEIVGYQSFMRVVAMKDDTEKEELTVIDEQYPHTPLQMRYNLAERNENFLKSVRALRTVFELPITLHLLDVEIDDNNTLRPRAFVIEPDHLIDVTAVAECYADGVSEPYLYLLRKVQTTPNTQAMMVGNIANFFLDTLLHNPDANFQETFIKVFKINPLSFATYSDTEVKSIRDATKKHFVTLQKMVKLDFQKTGIEPNDCFLEPSFASQKYGIQGRLDVFFRNSQDPTKSAIVELKSGKPFRPNSYGLSQNHFVQTMLYDMLIESTYKGELNPISFILYSVLDVDNLKYATFTKSQKYEALNVRNQLLAIEQMLINLNRKPFKEHNLIRKISPDGLPHISGFSKEHLTKFAKVYDALSLLERRYLVAFMSFVSREHQLAKVGMQGVENLNGVASLWLNDVVEKNNNFEILAYLKIEDNKSIDNEPFIRFRRSQRTNPLANFRLGDIAALYPYDKEGVTILDNQIFKCTITQINSEYITVRLRQPQLNQSIFRTAQYWNIEHDMLDSSFGGMYRGIVLWAEATERKRNLLLTTIPPQRHEKNEANIQENTFNLSPDLTDEQQRIIKKIIIAKDYFLLWGPPGTGKTSMVLKHLVDFLLKNTDENILLLAYTNRAVDEICESIESIGEAIKGQYLRIGSRFSTATEYHAQLLDKKIESVENRKELKEIIASHRIFVATVSAMGGKMELLQLKKFQRVLIDEASQILEPQLIGLLPHFQQFTLIGDHQQLPAVVTQPEKESATQDEMLHEIGLHNLRNSIFERLYKRCIAQNWHWAYDHLSHQGRMHQDIMRFPSEHFYQQKLSILPLENINTHFQTVPLNYLLSENKSEKNDDLASLLATKRMLFFDAQVGEKNQKTNAHEAQIVAKIVATFQQLYTKNGKAWKPSTLGVITPYRAQIAQIQASLLENDLSPDLITIDTVERYQGGARDIILLSLCTNQPSQLASLVSMNEEGIDRKLNVALTRARQHLIIIGNAEILNTNEIYRKLLAFLE